MKILNIFLTLKINKLNYKHELSREFCNINVNFIATVFSSRKSTKQAGRRRFSPSQPPKSRYRLSTSQRQFSATGEHLRPKQKDGRPDPLRQLHDQEDRLARTADSSSHRAVTEIRSKTPERIRRINKSKKEFGKANER